MYLLISGLKVNGLFILLQYNATQNYIDQNLIDVIFTMLHVHDEHLEMNSFAHRIGLKKYPKSIFNLVLNWEKSHGNFHKLTLSPLYLSNFSHK